MLSSTAVSLILLNNHSRGFILGFGQDWDPSLDSLIRSSGTPLVFTEYYQEVKKYNNYAT
jgi:hypothetical protein